MKENIILISSLIIIIFAIIGIAIVLFICINSYLYDKKTAKENEDILTLDLNITQLDEQTELKLKKQVVHFEEELRVAKNDVQKIEDNLNKLAMVLNLFEPETQQQLQPVMLPKDLSWLSFESQEERVHLMFDNLEAFLKVNDCLVDKKTTAEENRLIMAREKIANSSLNKVDCLRATNNSEVESSDYSESDTI